MIEFNENIMSTPFSRSNGCIRIEDCVVFGASVVVKTEITKNIYSSSIV